MTFPFKPISKVVGHIDGLVVSKTVLHLIMHVTNVDSSILHGHTWILFLSFFKEVTDFCRQLILEQLKLHAWWSTVLVTGLVATLDLRLKQLLKLLTRLRTLFCAYRGYRPCEFGEQCLLFAQLKFDSLLLYSFFPLWRHGIEAVRVYRLHLVVVEKIKRV